MKGEEGEGEAQQQCEGDDGDIEAAGICSCRREEPEQHTRQCQGPNVAAYCEGQQPVQIPASRSCSDQD